MSKKTETIEVRISPELKSQLGEVCKQRRQTMSRLIRQLVEDEISDFAQDSTGSGMSKMARTGSRRLRDLGLVGVSLVALALAWNVATQAPAAAQAEVRITFAEMDRNEDGVVTREEFERFAREEFVLDLDEGKGAGDEALLLPKACEVDFAAPDDAEVTEEVAEAFSDYDADKDGRLRYEELQTAMAQERREEFDEIDGDSDGFLSRKEFKSLMAGEDPRGNEGLSPECRQELAKLDAEAVSLDAEDLRLAFIAMDQDRDNRISREEFINN